MNGRLLDKDPIPNIVQAIADKEQLHPLAWRVETGLLVIVYVEGQKKTYDREEMLEATPDYRNMPVIHNPKVIEPNLPAGTVRSADVIMPAAAITQKSDKVQLDRTKGKSGASGKKAAAPATKSGASGKNESTPAKKSGAPAIPDPIAK